MNVPPDHKLLECLDCKGQFSITRERLYKMQKGESFELILPPCIFCGSKNVKSDIQQSFSKPKE